MSGEECLALLVCLLYLVSIGGFEDGGIRSGLLDVGDLGGHLAIARIVVDGAKLNAE